MQLFNRVLGRLLYQTGLRGVSRGRSLNGVQIEELNCSKLTGKVPCDSDASDQMVRLRRREWRVHVMQTGERPKRIHLQLLRNDNRLIANVAASAVGVYLAARAPQTADRILSQYH
ncbi:hypothetical protein EVAR_24446_1 [Eumeta japonica]|uniref:Uncharacterized protein n=1 Tax=Eumeta variegata TaxID=151549 RepID=A0A4C1WWI1_EUMVA|nr:hypothetical protein EVAR_24446_1 [Eumeta japonica]